MEKQINEKKPWFPKLFYVINSLKEPPVRFESTEKVIKLMAFLLY